MLNHVWTLLRNAAPDPADASRPGSAPVPAGFRPRPVDPASAAVRAAVFGADPDPVMLDCRARLFVRLILAGPLAPLARDRDPRLAFDPFDDAFARPDTWGPRADRPGGAFAGVPAAPDAAGRCVHRFRVAPPADPAEAVPLTGTGLTYRPPPGPPVDVEVWLRPQAGAADLLAAADALPATAALFAGDARPWPALRAAWAGDVGPDRLAALGLALAYRLDDGPGAA